MRTEQLTNGYHWLRICDASWGDPLDDTYARRVGGRWNSPDSWRTLYLNEDTVTARMNVLLFTADWPYEPEDLQPSAGPHLAVATLPRDQKVADVHTPDGVTVAGLPPTYPFDDDGQLVDHSTCQEIGAHIRASGLRGVRSRSAQAPLGAGRELAWFPATARSRASLIERLAFDYWYWS